jgi:hypothetical protein
MVVVVVASECSADIAKGKEASRVVAWWLSPHATSFPVDQRLTICCASSSFDWSHGSRRDLRKTRAGAGVASLAHRSHAEPS